MEILVSGNLTQVSEKFFLELEKSHKCVIITDEKEKYSGLKDAVLYSNDEADNEMERIFNTFQFETVIFISKAIDGALKVFDELEKLENMLYLCRHQNVSNFIYITTNDLIGYNEKRNQEKSRHILMSSCESLCNFYSTEYDISTLILRIPYLFSKEAVLNQLNEWIKQAVKQNTIAIRAPKGVKTDFLNEEDLGVLISRIVNEPITQKVLTCNLSGGNELTFEAVAELIKNELPAVEISYQNKVKSIPRHEEDGFVRKEYGWFPVTKVADVIPELVKNYKKKDKEKSTNRKFRIFKNRTESKLRVIFEIILLFAFANLLNLLTQNNTMVNFIDFRLIFVIILAGMNGMVVGVLAAILACVSYVFFRAQTSEWQVIFYNVQNWLPFAFYFLIGTLIGYSKDKYEDSLQYKTKEHEILEDKYIFLNELYLKVLQDKDTYNSRIIGYKDSFGKIYSIVKKLDSTLEEEVFYEAIRALEDILESTAVAIYSVSPNTDYARLTVCSKNINSDAKKSVKISEYPEMLAMLSQNKTFVNSNCFENYPSYAAPIYKNKKLIGIILILYAQEYQMNMEFLNKFNIVSDLIHDSLLRAMDKFQLNDMMLQGTDILSKDKFSEILQVRNQMKEREYSAFTLLKILPKDRTLMEVGNIVSSLVRNNDVLGEGEEGNLYLLLSQTSHSDLDIVGKRLESHNIDYQLVTI